MTLPVLPAFQPTGFNYQRPSASSLYTAHVAYPIATPDVVRNEIRNAVEEGRAPIPQPVSASTLAPFGTPITPVNPEAGVPPPSLPALVESPLPAPPGTPKIVRFFQQPAVTNALIGGAAVAAGIGIAYLIFR